MQVFKSKWLNILLTVVPKAELKQKREDKNKHCSTPSFITGCQMGQVLWKNPCVTVSLEAESPCEGRERGGGAGVTAAT